MKEMKCREFDEVVHGFVRMELLDVNVREAALEHAAHCELCSERMADAAALAEASEMMGRSSHGEQAPAQVEASLVTAFRKLPPSRLLATHIRVDQRGSGCCGAADFPMDVRLAHENAIACDAQERRFVSVRDAARGQGGCHTKAVDPAG